MVLQIFLKSFPNYKLIDISNNRHQIIIACGNKNRFTCPYHGWTYSNRGDLIGVLENDKVESPGRLLDGVDLTFSKDNEILIEVPWMFLGYYGLD